MKKNCWVLYGRFSERILNAEYISKHSYINKLAHQPRPLDMEQVEIMQFRKPISEPYIKTKDYSSETKLPGIESLLRQINGRGLGINAGQCQCVQPV